MRRSSWISLGLTACLFSMAALAENKPSLDAASLREQVVAHERGGLESLRTEDRAPFNSSLAEEAVFLDSHGPATRAEVVEHTAAFRIHDFTMSDIRFVPLDKNSGLIVYALTESGESHGHEFSAKVYVSAIWAKRGGKWLCLFSQETAAK
jgi:hypothetical protein